ncbi:MAG TPA: lysylphosphatidylglycerol synthase domain-containing protein [Kofleriaceae bacterium]|nr:lysylphosphatidylglycerol synthase domain-containing protein [Kofleriaceae bacterium]
MADAERAKHRWWWVLALVAFGALGLYLGAPDTDVLHGAWGRLRAHPIAAIAIVAGGAIGLAVTEALRIAVIGRLVGVRIHARDAWDAAVANHVMTAITPQIGLGEPTVAYTLGKRGVPWDAAVAVPFIKFTTSLALVFLLGALLVASGYGPPVDRWARIGAVIWFLGIAAITILVIEVCSRPAIAERWIGRLAGWFRRRRDTESWQARVDRAAKVTGEMVHRLARARGLRSAGDRRHTGDDGAPNDDRASAPPEGDLVEHAAVAPPGRVTGLFALIGVHLVYYASYVAPLVGIALVLGEPPALDLSLRALVFLCFIFATPIPGGTGVSEAAAGVFFADLLAPADAIIAVAVFRAATYYLQLLIGALYLPIRSLALSKR